MKKSIKKYLNRAFEQPNKLKSLQQLRNFPVNVPNFQPPSSFNQEKYNFQSLMK